MEIPYFPFNFTTLLLLSSFIFLLIKSTLDKPDSTKKHGKPAPSPPKLPLVGHLHHFVGKQPHRAFHKLARKYGPILHLKLGQVSIVVISSREAAKEALTVQDLACGDRPDSIGSKIMFYDYKDLVFTPYGDYWGQIRKIWVMEVLSVKHVKSFGYIIQEEVSRLVKCLRYSSGEVVDLSEELFRLMGAITCRAVVGKMDGNCETLVGLAREALTMSGGYELADLFPSSKLLDLLCLNKHKLVRMRRKLDDLLDLILEEHKSKQGREFDCEYILDVLLRMQKTGDLQFPITNNYIKAIIFDMLAGGSETSSSTVDWAMTELLRNPRVMAKAQAEIRQAFNEKKVIEESDIEALKYLKLVIKETLRLHPPAPVVPRACREECVVDGYTVPLKSKVMINIWSIGRDPQCWDDPESFKPERFENGNIDYLGSDFKFTPFGAGRRMCPGMNFGLANVELTLSQFLYHFNWKMRNGMTPNDINMNEEGGFVAKRLKNSPFFVPIIYDSSTDQE